MKNKNHEESDLQCNVSHFRNYMRKFYHKIFFNTESFRSFLIQAWVLLLLLITPGRNRGNTKFSSIPREYSVIDFTVGGLLENVKILPLWIYGLFCNKGAQGGGLQKHNIYHICIFDHYFKVSYTIGLVSMCKNHEIL